MDEVAALLVGGFGFEMNTHDIAIENQTGGFQRISELHHAYLPLQYPLLFLYGDDDDFKLRIDIGYFDIKG